MISSFETQYTREKREGQANPQRDMTNRKALFIARARAKHKKRASQQQARRAA